MTTAESTGALNLSWQPDLRDYIEAFTVRNRARKARLKIGVIAVLWAVIIVVTGGGGPLSVALGIVVVVGMQLAVPLIVHGSTWQLWRRNPALRAPVTALVDPGAGITVAALTKGEYPWSSVDSVLETDRVFVVQLAGYRNKAFVLLAKRGLDDPARVADLRSALLR